MASEDVQTNIRLPAELKDRLVASADLNKRSLSAEISERLTRTYQDQDAIKVMNGNMVLLRALADFVIMRHRYPEETAAFAEPILKMAHAIRETDDYAKLREITKPSLLEYIDALATALSKVTEVLGPGWGKDFPVKPKKNDEAG